jgi:hypothetical protein
MRWFPALFATLVLALGGCGSSKTLSQHAFSKEVETVQSTAAEGAMLASQVARGRTTEPFARIHSGKLAEQAKKSRKLLRAAKAPGLEDERRQAADTAGKVEQALGRLHESPADGSLARRLEHELEQDAATAGKLAG